MSRTVQCVVTGTESEGLDYPPFPDELGQRIYEQVSKPAWQRWLGHQTMLINEYRLDLMSETGQRIWMDELDKFFWGEGSKLPPEFTPTKS